MDHHTFVVSTADSGERIDVVLARTLGVPRSQAARQIDAGFVRLNGRVAARSTRVRAGDRVEIAPPPPAERPPPPPLPPIRYEDDHLLVVAKPAGLVVHPGSGHDGDTLVDALIAAGYPLATAAGAERPGVVHRLDRDTSGLLVLAKTDEAYRGLVEAMAQRHIRRQYLALVEGRMPAARGRIEIPIGRHPTDRTRFAPDPEGRAATTRWQVRTEGEVDGDPVSLLELTLETGRTHQIRVHLSAAGHPVLGDRTYGGERRTTAALGLTRPFLHAARLEFTHPITGAHISVEEPLPEELSAAARRAHLEPG